MGSRVQGLGLRLQGLGSRVQGLGLRLQGLGLRVQGLGSRVQGLGFRAMNCHVGSLPINGSPKGRVTAGSSKKNGAATWRVRETF